MRPVQSRTILSHDRVICSDDQERPHDLLLRTQCRCGGLVGGLLKRGLATDLVGDMRQMLVEFLLTTDARQSHLNPSKAMQSSFLM